MPIMVILIELDRARLLYGWDFAQWGETDRALDSRSERYGAGRLYPVAVAPKLARRHRFSHRVSLLDGDRPDHVTRQAICVNDIGVP